MQELIVLSGNGSNCVYIAEGVIPPGVLPEFEGGECILDGEPSEVVLLTVAEGRKVLLK